MSAPLRFRDLVAARGGSAILRFGRAGAGAVARDARVGIKAPWGPAPAVAVRASSIWGGVGPISGGWRAPWGDGIPVMSPIRCPWSSGGPPALISVRAPWGGMLAAQPRIICAPWGGVLGLHSAAGLPWAPGAAIMTLALAGWMGSDPVLASSRAPWAPPLPTMVARRLIWLGGSRQVVAVRARWQEGRDLWSFGAAVADAVSPPPPPPPDGFVPSALLRFRVSLASRGASAILRFGRSGRVAAVVIPVRRTYIVVYGDHLTRASDGAEVPCLDMQLTLDSLSWAWSFSARLPLQAQSLVERSDGDPVELVAHIGSDTVRVLAESMVRDREFPGGVISVKGRGRTAWLDAPFSPIQTWSNPTSAQTSQQLLDAVLPYGWSADWQMTAWLVPAGVWSHQGTPITAAQAIVGAAGGYLQPHATDQVLRALPRFPVAPWDLAGATPDFDLPPNVMTREGIEWIQRPDYNLVYVCGQTSGGRYRVKRAGTAGDLPAPMVTDALVTHPDAGRQRGISILADTGIQAIETLQMPVLPGAGIILPGKIVRYFDGGVSRTGISRSVQIDSRFPKVFQTVTVHTYGG